MKTIIESPRRLKVRDCVDVLVIGGGIAGVAAAIAAAREGATTVLVEKELSLGGLATLGNINVYLPLCDGTGQKVSGGLAEELLKLSVRDGSAARSPRGADIPDCWKHKATRAERAANRYVSRFNPATYAMELERRVLRQGVKLLYDTRFCSIRRTGKRISHAMFEDKGGRFAVQCRAIVDASGDADACMAAGERLDHCRVNVACGWFHYLTGENRTVLEPFSRSFDFYAQILPAEGERGYGVADGAEVTAMALDSNRRIERRIAELRREQADPGLHLIRASTVPSYRMTRRLIGAYELREADDRIWFDDTVGMIGHWRKRGPIFCIPLRSLYSPHTENLLVAGRCISNHRDAWDITRVIPACAVTGEAAGVASAMLRATGTISRLCTTDLQARLRRRRAVLDPRLLEQKATQPDAGGLAAEGLAAV